MPDIEERTAPEVEIGEIEKEIKELEASLAKTRNTVEKALLADKIAEKYKAITDIKNPAPEKEVVSQKDAPAVMDHKNSRQIIGGGYANTGSSFLTLF